MVTKTLTTDTAAEYFAENGNYVDIVSRARHSSAFAQNGKKTPHEELEDIETHRSGHTQIHGK